MKTPPYTKWFDGSSADASVQPRSATQNSQGQVRGYYDHISLPDNKHAWGSEAEYFSEEAKKAVWNTHNGSL
ncbi:MAG: hypothetical protein IJN29_13555 [Akkermansia sp.]|nr:hypothetical protein [Akkermansia sp.]